MQSPTHIVWNIFLAVVPVALALLFALGARRQRDTTGRINWIAWSPVLLLWLAFLPNTAYLLTEWRHYLEILTTTPQVFLLARHSPRYMFDFLWLSTFYVVYTGIGVASFYLALWPVDRIVRPHWIVRGLFFIVCSLGVYVGLIPRYNSWNLAHEPYTVWHTAVAAMLDLPLCLLVIGFGLFLWGLYFVFGLAVDGLKVRIEQRRLGEPLADPHGAV
jgi:uncharacterized membrane protein